MHRIALRSLSAANCRPVVAMAVTLVAALRLCHLRLLWADEDYHLAAAINILHGKLPYRDFWYDKPPLSAIYYLLVGGHAGWPLRLLDTLYVLLACWLAFRLARAWWGEAEGRLAAMLLAFYLTFYLPSAAIAFAADALMIVPHLAAIYFAFTGRAFVAGLCCACAFLVNAKAVFVAAVCGVWLLSSLPGLCLGFALPLALAGAVASVSGTWPGYYEQVWRWGWLYAAKSPVVHPVMTGLARTLDWLGFHSALAGGTTYAILTASRTDRAKLASWLVLSFAAVCLGTRFAPHYFLQLLPPMVIAGSRGIAVAFRRYRSLTVVFLSVALLVPFVRFGPRYASLGYDALLGRSPRWTDAVMDLDSHAAAAKIRAVSQPGDTLFVWGYRPDIYVWTRLTADGIFWDSQPLTGVPADRHLKVEKPIFTAATSANRGQLAKTAPKFVVDGLGPLNPSLAIGKYPDLRAWLKHYALVGKTKFCTIYERSD